MLLVLHFAGLSRPLVIRRLVFLRARLLLVEQPAGALSRGPSHNGVRYVVRPRFVRSDCRAVRVTTLFVGVRGGPPFKPRAAFRALRAVRSRHFQWRLNFRQIGDSSWEGGGVPLNIGLQIAIPASTWGDQCRRWHQFAWAIR